MVLVSKNVKSTKTTNTSKSRTSKSSTTKNSTRLYKNKIDGTLESYTGARVTRNRRQLKIVSSDYRINSTSGYPIRGFKIHAGSNLSIKDYFKNSYDEFNELAKSVEKGKYAKYLDDISSKSRKEQVEEAKAKLLAEATALYDKINDFKKHTM